MHGVSGALGHYVAQNAVPGQREVADQVQDFVADKFVREAQRPIEHALPVEDDGALFGYTANQAHIAQHGLVFFEAEGARRSDFIGVAARGQIDHEALPPNRRGEINLVGDAVALTRIHADKLVAFAHFHAFQDAEILAPPPLRLESRGGEGFHIGQCAAIEDGQLQVVQFHDYVVHAHADERGEQVFGGLNQHALAHQAGGVAHLGHIASNGGNLEVVEVGAAKQDAASGGRGQQAHRDGRSAMQSNAGKADRGSQRVFQMRSFVQMQRPRAHEGYEGIDYLQARKLRCGVFDTFFVHQTTLEKPVSSMKNVESAYKAVTCDSKLLIESARRREDPLLDLIQALVELESPSDDKAAVDRCVDFVAETASVLGARVRRHRRHEAGDILEARFDPPKPLLRPGKPILLLGHLDTVWPLGTLAEMPFRVEKGRAFGPGVYDMKAGAAMALTALEMLRAEGLPHRPVTLLLVSDEEVGSHASRALTEKLALAAERVYVLEPAQGVAGAYKTARKGVANYRVQVDGVAAHSGVNFEAGHSAIHELAYQTGVITSFTDLKRGLTVNIGTIQGGTRSNVVAASAWAEVDVRVARASDFARIDRRMRSLRARDKGCVLTVTGELNRPPMERTRANAALYRRAATLAAGLGFDLHEAATGGGSDGNFTAALGVPTLDGMGAVGEGAHARNESVVIKELAPRMALLVTMLCEP